MLLLQKQQEIKAKLASDDFRDFVQYTKPDYEINWHHDLLMDYLQQFAEGKIKKLMVFMPPQHGKLLPIETPILTTKGWVNHGDLKPGDYVFGQDGMPKMVLANSGAYEWKVVNMNFQDGKSIKCANEHLWNINNSQIIETKDLFKYHSNPYINISKFVNKLRISIGLEAITNKLFIKSIIDENEFVQGNCIQVEDSMYLAGYDLIPTHNSELTSRRLPAYLLGRNPKLKIIGCSYSSDLATSFNRDVQRIIDDQKYSEIFPDTTLNGAGAKAKGNYLRNSDMFEIVEHRGFYKSIGVGGSLTGTPADIGIIDDPVKDAIEAESITYRSRVWDWFTQVFMTRLHNDSQIIVTQTRWNLDDLSGRILSRMNHDKSWTILSLPAICEGATSIHDVREPGEALWESKHSLKRLMEIKVANPRAFQALYQQDPKPFEGGLVFSKWNSISLEDFNQVKGLDGYGMDFGYNDPTVLLHVKIDKVNKKLYINEKLYKSNLTSETIRNELIRLDISKNTRIIADNARPEIIAELRKVFNMKPSTKGANSIYYGILKILEFELYITRNSHNVIREIGSYRYKEDKDGNFSNEVVEIDDHSMDALRYIVRDLVDGDKGVLAFG